MFNSTVAAVNENELVTKVVAMATTSIEQNYMTRSWVEEGTGIAQKRITIQLKWRNS